MTQSNNKETTIEQVFEKAWSDETFKQELLTNPKTILTQELGADIPENIEIKAFEDTAKNHYLVIPMSSDIDTAAIGEDAEPIVRLIARASQDPALKEEMLNNPKAVIERELGISIPEGVEFNALAETENTSYLVLPENPNSTEELSDEELEAVSGGWVGAAVAAAGLAWDVYKYGRQKKWWR